MEKIDYSQNSGGIFGNIDKSTETGVFEPGKVRKSKDKILKTRIQTLLEERGISEPEFYKKIGLNKQSWYDLSWGRLEPKVWLKVKIAKKLGIDSLVIWH